MDSKSLEKKLSSVKESSEDIQALSRWCIQHRSHHHSIVQAWSRAIRKAKVGHRLTLFYVCNDVVQNAKRKKCPELVQYFGTAVKEAAPLVREDKVRRKILRIFNIWEERGIYDSKLVAEFINIVEKAGTVNSTENDVVISSFQLEQLVESVRNLVALERTSNNLLADLKTQEHMLTEEEIKVLRVTVKERGASRERLEEFEESVSSLEFYITSLQNEIDERTKAVTLLEQAEIFYETQRGEAKLVSTAYKNFNSQVKFLRKKLLDKVPNLPEPVSPVPTPPLDAPSPQSDFEEVTEDDHQNNEELNSFLNSSTTSFVQRARDSLHSEMSSEVTPPVKRDAADSPKLSRSASKERILEEEQQEFEMQIANFSKPSKPYMDAKPMNARELLDTFGKSVTSPSVATPVTLASFQIPLSAPPVPPLPPEPPMAPYMPPISSPNFPPPPRSVLPSIPLPPSAPPPALPPSIPLPQAFPPPPLPPHPAHMRFPPPLPKPAPYEPFRPSVPAAAPPTTWSDSWPMPLPPPPPPPPPMASQEPRKLRVDPGWQDGGQFAADDWNSYDAADEPQEDEDDCGINWGEPPGTEELQTFEQLQAAADDNKASFLIPPPPPPPHFSNSDNRDNGMASPKRNSNLVNIEPLSEGSSDGMHFQCYDYRSLTSEPPSFGGLFNSGDTDMRVVEPPRKRTSEGSGSDMDISEGEASDFERPGRHKRGSIRKDHPKRLEESPHKPVSFSLAKGSKPLIPLTDKSSGFNQDEDDPYKKKSLPMPPSYAKRQKLQEKNAKHGDDRTDPAGLSVLPEPLITDVDTTIITKALDSVRDLEAVAERESREPSISEALGMYYDSDNESDTGPHTEPDPATEFYADETEHSAEKSPADDNKSSVENISNAHSISQAAAKDSPKLEPRKQSAEIEFSQVIESFISDTRASEGDKPSDIEEPVQQEGLTSYSDGGNAPINVPEHPYEDQHIEEPVQPIAAMHSGPPYGNVRPWQGNHSQGTFYQNRPPRPHLRGFPPRPGPFYGGRGGGFRGGSFNPQMRPPWHPRGSRQPWW